MELEICRASSHHSTKSPVVPQLLLAARISKEQNTDQATNFPGREIKSNTTRTGRGRTLGRRRRGRACSGGAAISPPARSAPAGHAPRRRRCRQHRDAAASKRSPGRGHLLPVPAADVSCAWLSLAGRRLRRPPISCDCAPPPRARQLALWRRAVDSGGQVDARLHPRSSRGKGEE